jgi:hypothetical protein
MKSRLPQIYDVWRVHVQFDYPGTVPRLEFANPRNLGRLGNGFAIWSGTSILPAFHFNHAARFGVRISSPSRRGNRGEL